MNIKRVWRQVTDERRRREMEGRSRLCFALFEGEDQSQWSDARGEEGACAVWEKGIDRV